MGTTDTIPNRRTSIAGKGVNFLWTAIYNIIQLFGFFWTLLNLRMNKGRSRIKLKNLSNEQLLDIGITRREADEEAAKSFWN